MCQRKLYKGVQTVLKSTLNLIDRVKKSKFFERKIFYGDGKKLDGGSFNYV